MYSLLPQPRAGADRTRLPVPSPAHGRARLNGGDIAVGEVGHTERLNQRPEANGAAAATRSERLRLISILGRALPRALGSAVTPGRGDQHDDANLQLLTISGVSKHASVGRGGRHTLLQHREEAVFLCPIILLRLMHCMEQWRAVWSVVVGGISRGKLPCGPRLQHGEREAAGGVEVAYGLPPGATRVTIARTLIVPRAQPRTCPLGGGSQRGQQTNKRASRQRTPGGVSASAGTNCAPMVMFGGRAG